MQHIKLAKRALRVYNARVSVSMRTYTGGPIACNGYLLQGADGSYVAVDAPLGMAEWVQRVLPAGAKLAHLLLTHQHFDHVQGAAALQQLTGCAIHAPFAMSDELTLAAVARQWGLPPIEPYEVDAFGTAQTSADWAGLRWQLYFIPGHSRDGMAYGLADEELLFSGDILFAGAVGRADFPGGSAHSLVSGIREHLLPLPDTTRVCCGHGPSTTIGEERMENPYIV